VVFALERHKDGLAAVKLFLLLVIVKVDEK
jgi:hypothetical protein